MKKIIILIASILGGGALATIICFVLVDWKVYNWTLDLSDWLSAACALLSLAGTVILAFVAVYQNDKANKQNEALVKQNEELQKINDKQFRIANQRYYPLLQIDNVDFVKGEIELSPDLERWTDRATSSINKDNAWAFINIDDRNSCDAAPSSCSKLSFDLTNISDARIKFVNIYGFYSSIKRKSYDTFWLLDSFILEKGQKIGIEMMLYHDDDSYIKKAEVIYFKLYLKMEIITNEFFYEELDVNIPAGMKGFGEIFQISDNPIKMDN